MQTNQSFFRVSSIRDSDTEISQNKPLPYSVKFLKYLHVIHFTINICACSEKVKYELKKNKISQLFKANFFWIFHTRDAKDGGDTRNVLLCIFHSWGLRRRAVG